MPVQTMNKSENTPHLEMEVKILEIDPGIIIQKLEAIGAKKIFDGMMFIEGFDFPLIGEIHFNQKGLLPRFSPIFAEIGILSDGSQTLISQGAYLRLRKEGERSELILKWKDQNNGRKGVKRENELSIPIGAIEWDEVRNMIEQTGLKRILIQQKKRKSYVYYPDLRFDIDEWPKITPYLEVEGPDVETISKGLRLIGFSMKEASPISGKEVFEKYGIDPSYLVFEESE